MRIRLMIKAKYQKMYTEKYKQDMDFVIIGKYYIGPFVDMDTAQKAVNAINSQFSPQPKHTSTEYEKVTESIFDLRDEFERGDLYTKGRGDGGDFFKQITTEYELLTFATCGLYRKVEKEIDWRDEAHTKLQSDYHWSTPIAEVINDDSDYFLELCRVALRANGEIE